MRPLTLHVSALTDSEYHLYTASLDDLAPDVPDDAHYERTAVGAREVRAWLRGRYSHLPASDIDSILKLFSPNMLPSDTLTGGQFFAALRLVLHAESGKGVDRALAFVQASPRTDSLRPLSPPRRLGQAPPSHPDHQRQPPPHTPSPETNPFVRRSVDQPASPPDPEQHPPQRPNRISQNPFLARDHVIHPSQVRLPPLPPRKPSLLTAPPRRPSDAAPSPITSTASLTTPSGPPLIPIKPTHVMSPLMRHSLEASKHAQSLKRAEEQLDRERVLSVLKTTSSSSTVCPSARTRSLSPSKQTLAASNGNGHGSQGSDDATSVPPLPVRRKPSLPSSTSSVLSLEQVATATLPSPTAPSRPPLPTRDPWSHAHAEHAGPPTGQGSGPIRPPTHPYRRPSTSPSVNHSTPPSPRTARSHSINVPPSTAPPPPPRRKRPESMCLTLDSDSSEPTTPKMHAGALSTSVSRHLSLTRPKGRDPPLPLPLPPSADATSMSNLQRTLSNLHLRAQPKLDAVRYKAEAGISRRGYVHHSQLGPTTRWRDEGELGLMADARWMATDVDRDLDSPTTDDDDQCSGEARRADKRDFMTESDNLKWPMGEGWKPL